MTLGRLIRTLAFPIAIGTFGALILLERRRPLRREVESKTARTGRNLAMAGAAALSMHLIERPVAQIAASLVDRRNIGLLKVVPLPEWIARLAAVVLLDYTLYAWHVLTHRIRFLWRFHVVHHVDLDLDASTAVRFHFGELTISVAWRAAQILVLGVSTKSLNTWQALLIPAILFHHSNVALPERLENFLSKFLVTPRLHGIHHSVIQAETDSNWSSGLSIWDRLHGTFRDIDQHRKVTIGVPAYQLPQDVTLGQLIKLPFVQPRSSWLLPERPTGDE